MKVLDPGHKYYVDVYDNSNPRFVPSHEIVFMKREGEGYPFNVGQNPGTNCQELIRVLLDRVEYLQKQIPCVENRIIIGDLQDALWQFEKRAAERHGRSLAALGSVSQLPKRETCRKCGHVGCDKHCLRCGSQVNGDGICQNYGCEGEYK